MYRQQELVDSIVNGNLDSGGNTKRQRTEGLSWADELGSDQLHLKLLCGGDLLESFGKPGLWKDEDVSRAGCCGCPGRLRRSGFCISNCSRAFFWGKMSLTLC